MTIHLFARGKRATSITTIAVLGVMALLLAPSTPARAASGRPMPVLAQGAGMGAQPSAKVRVVQRVLHHRGYELGAPGVDGRFGPLTAAAVRKMQADYGLAVDGIVGDHTRKALGLTRRTVGTQRRSHAEHGSQSVLERGPTAGQAPRHANARITPVRNASVELNDRSSTSWLDSLLAGAFGALITFLLAIAVVARRRHRDGKRSTPTLSPPVFAHATDPRSDDQPAPAQNMQVAPNHNGGAHVSANGASSEAPPSCLPPGHRVIGYVTLPPEPGVSDDDGSSEAIQAMCERCGWELLQIVRDREVGPTLDRPGLGYALGRIARREADGLVVSDLKRVSRSIVDLGALMGWFRNAQAALIALDLGIDTSTPRGHHVATTLITLSDHAHERIAYRHGNGLADIRAARRTGRPAVRDDPELLRRIAAMRAAHMTLQAIADQLNGEEVPTLRGGRKWRPSSIQAALGYRRPGSRDHLPSLDERSVRT
jgi:DNA invertase Pin-like site-specific DNA recombinase/peptidoglycan hydrolase-like protein with peptidoglycan-binding domain